MSKNTEVSVLQKEEKMSEADSGDINVRRSMSPLVPFIKPGGECEADYRRAQRFCFFNTACYFSFPQSQYIMYLSA